MSDVLKAHCDAIDASLGLLKVQLDAIRHAISVQPKPVTKTDPVRLERCRDVSPRLCAVLDDEARIDRRSFGNPNAWECAGCGYPGSTADMEAGE